MARTVAQLSRPLILSKPTRQSAGRALYTVSAPGRLDCTALLVGWLFVSDHLSLSTQAKQWRRLDCTATKGSRGSKTASALHRSSHNPCSGTEQKVMRRALACAVVASVAAAFGPFAKKPTPPPRGADPEKQFDGATLSSRDKVSAYNRPPEDSALLSERWKAAWKSNSGRARHRRSASAQVEGGRAGRGRRPGARGRPQGRGAGGRARRVLAGPPRQAGRVDPGERPVAGPRDELRQGPGLVILRNGSLPRPARPCPGTRTPRGPSCRRGCRSRATRSTAARPAA